MNMPNTTLPMLWHPADAWGLFVTSYPPPAIEFVGALAVQLIFFWIPCLIYMALPSLAPAFAERHRLQPSASPPTRPEALDCLRIVLRNQLVSMTIHALLLAANVAAGKPSRYRIDARFPGAGELVRDVVLSVLVRETAFYYTHRLLHTPALYARVHKRHHRFVAPFSLAAQYASVSEHIIANVLPVALPGLLFPGTHILSYWAFVASVLVDTSTVHSGYDFFGGLAKMHDAHHELFVVNYGVCGLLDWVHGTDRIRKPKVNTKAE